MRWARGDRDQAIQQLRTLEQNLQRHAISPEASAEQSRMRSAEHTRLHALVLLSCGRWLIQSGSESSTTIREKFLKVRFV